MRTTTAKMEASQSCRQKIERVTVPALGSGWAVYILYTIHRFWRSRHQGGEGVAISSILLHAPNGADVFYRVMIRNGRIHYDETRKKSGCFLLRYCRRRFIRGSNKVARLYAGCCCMKLCFAQSYCRFLRCLHLHSGFSVFVASVRVLR